MPWDFSRRLSAAKILCTEWGAQWVPIFQGSISRGRIEPFGAEIRGSEVSKGHNDTTLVGGRPYFDRIQCFLEQIAPG